MNWLDVVLALILGLSVGSGIFKGFSKVAVGFLSTLAGIVLGLWFYGPAGAFLQPYVSHKGLADFIGFFLVFGACLMAGALVGYLLGKLLKWAGLGWVDRMLGAGVGLLRGLLIAVVLVMALMAFTPKPPPQSVVKSRIAPYVVDAARFLAAAAPRELKDGVQASYEKVKEMWRETLKPGLTRQEL